MTAKKTPAKDEAEAEVVPEVVPPSEAEPHTVEQTLPILLPGEGQAGVEVPVDTTHSTSEDD